MTLRAEIYQGMAKSNQRLSWTSSTSHFWKKILNIPEHTLNTYPNAYGNNFYGNFHRQLWEWTFIKGSWIGLTLVAYNVTFMKTANIDFYEVVSVKQITDFWLRVLCMNFLRQVKWGPHIEMGGTSFNGRRRALLHGNRFWEIPSTATAAYYCLNAGNRNGYNMQAMARMGILSMDDLNRQVVDEKRGN